MFTRLRRFVREWRDYKAFQSLAQKRLVFYVEGPGYWSHFEPVFRALQEQDAGPVIYLASGHDDPLLSDPLPGLLPFCIGEGIVRTMVFAGLQAEVVVMTMPELHTWHIKRSVHKVHYIYLHHSIASTHMIYPANAFDYYDSICCVGPHHVAETRAREQQQGLSAKTLVEHGYGRLDTILEQSVAGPPKRGQGKPPRVLVAPSWGENGLIERHGRAVIEPLLGAGLEVTLRPHPRTRKFYGEVLDGIAECFRDEPCFTLDEDMDSYASLQSADVMVSDWSGAAMEFALGLERPVLFVDVPRKVRNPEYESLGIEPLEVRIRSEIGEIVDEQALDTIGNRAVAMAAQAERWQAAIREARARWIYNPGHSARAAAQYIHGLLDGPR